MRQGWAILLLALAFPSGSTGTAFATSPSLDPGEWVRACGTDESGPPVPAPDPRTIDGWDRDGRLTAGGQIPVYFHVIHDGIEVIQGN